jgi:hypothetical protein
MPQRRDELCQENPTIRVRDFLTGRQNFRDAPREAQGGALKPNIL